MDKGDRQAIIHSVAQSQTQLKQLSMHLLDEAISIWHPTPVLLPGKSHGQRIHGVAKSRTRLSDFTFTFLFHALKKEMATHSSILAWRIPGSAESGGLPSMGPHRAGHD